MYFKRMELNGFKSFADPVTIEFTDGTTCIVGPNGSGKSNISDAVRWVLGEQSPKMLRGGKMEEVIFSGTQSRKPKGMAEVTLVIDNSDHMLPIDYAEVGITRRMYRNGESEYMINRNPCRLKDIRELIMDTGIGVEGYSIIGQGKIADIISNKMDSRREIFEEAAGIVKYRNKKAEAEKKLENAGLNLSRVNDIIGEIESRIGGLKEDSEKASEYLEIRDKYRDIEINIILNNIEAADGRTDAVKTEMEEISGILEADRVSREEMENEIGRFRKESGELEEQLDALRSEIALKTESIHAAENVEERNMERLSSLERDRIRIEAELTSIEDKIAREQAECGKAESAKAEVEEEARQSQKAAEDKKAAAESLRMQLELEEAKLEQLKSVIFDLSGRASAARVEAQSMENLSDALKKRLERLNEEGSEAIDGSFEDRRRIAAAELAEAEKEAENLKLSAAETALDRENINGRLAEAFARIEDIRIASGKLSARYKLLDELEKAYEGYGGSVRYIMQSGLKGIIGTVGELMGVPAGWELAVETALGGNVQNIVCKDEASAKKAVELLKANKAGRVTFLPADSLRPNADAKKGVVESSRGFLGFAADRVSCRGGYEKVVEYLLGKVAVFDNLDNALDASRSGGGLRFVTLEGEHINPAGAITGGSFKNNSANIISRKAEKEALEKEIEEKNGELIAAEESRKKLENSKADAARKLLELEGAMRNAQMRAALVAQELEQLAASEEEAKDAEGRRLAEKSELEKEIEESFKAASAVLEKARILDEERAAAEEEASAAAIAAGESRQNYAFAKAQETAALMEESAAALRAKNAADMETRMAAAIKEMETEKQTRVKALESIAVQEADMKRSALEGAEGLESRKQEKARLEQQEEGLMQRRRTLLSEGESLEERRRNFESVFYEHQLKKHDAELRLARFEAQGDSLREKLWEEFEISHAQAADRADPGFVMSRGVKESREFKERLKALGDVNIGAIEEYRAVSERYGFLSAQREDLNKAIGELRTVISDIDATIKARFKENFDAVVENFESTFTELFKGGHARLTLEDPSNPLESAIDIEAQPPGKKLQNMNLLSGGEKTMTAIALMFAVLKAKPTPFCILDEVEAALDDTNIDCFARYLRNFSNTQFTLITHQKATMEHADVLYGVTMPEQGITKVLSLKLGDSFDI